MKVVLSYVRPTMLQSMQDIDFNSRAGLMIHHSGLEFVGRGFTELTTATVAGRL